MCIQSSAPLLPTSACVVVAAAAFPFASFVLLFPESHG